LCNAGFKNSEVEESAFFQNLPEFENLDPIEHVGFWQNPANFNRNVLSANFSSTL
jgi:hypothetical protein